MSFLTVAYYTINTPYQQESENLRRSLDKLNMPHTIQGIPNKGNWIENCAMKPWFIKHMLEANPGKDILYVDCDAVIHSYPSFFDSFIGDIGVYYLKNELLSGTIFIPHSINSNFILDTWISKQKPDKWDQKVLQEVLEENKFIKVTLLPPTYCQIFDLMKNVGEPVIEHFQASRRFKSLVKIKDTVMVQKPPLIIENMRTRIHQDNSFSLPRKNRAAELRLDKEYIRCPGELRWICKIDSKKSLSDLQPDFENKICYIVGKGPSLDNLTLGDFPEDGPVIGLNEAVHVLAKLNLPNRLFCVQQDPSLRNTCFNSAATMIVSSQAAQHYDDPYIYYGQQFKLGTIRFSAVCAISIAKLLKVKKIKLMCFDAATVGKLGYSKSIPYSPETGGNPRRFLTHKHIIEAFLKGTSYEWIKPRVPEIPVSCTQQL